MAVLDAREIRKTFREGREVVEVLRGANVSLERGEVVALAGPSGSGKSTLLCILGCILAASSGHLVVGGYTVSKDTDLPKVRSEQIGFVFQQFNLIPALSSLDNVAYAARLRGSPRREARQKAAIMLERVGLGDRARFLPHELSGGQKQRVAIARALVTEPHVLLADEPTANLDAAVGAQVLELFTTLTRQGGRALLIVTHDPRVAPLCDRALRIDEGRVYPVG